MAYVEPTPAEREAYAARLQEIADATAKTMSAPQQRETVFHHTWANGGAGESAVVTADG